MRTQLSIVALALTTLVACTGVEEIEEAPKADVVEAPKEEAKAPEVKIEGLKVDVAASSINFVGAKVTKAHDGGFKAFDGGLVMDGGEPKSTTFIIDMKSTWADAERLTAHLQDEDFFNVEQFPESTFVSSSIAKDGDAYKVTGMLTMHGQTKEVAFPATITEADGAVKMTSEFSINRKLWGISFPGKPEDLIKDEVLIKLDLSFPQA